MLGERAEFGQHLRIGVGQAVTVELVGVSGGVDEFHVEPAQRFGGDFSGLQLDALLREGVGVGGVQRLDEEAEMNGEIKIEDEERGDAGEVQIDGGEQGARLLGEAGDAALRSDDGGAAGRRNDGGGAHRVPPVRRLWCGARGRTA